MSNDTPPDFAMTRAVEILAQIYQRQRTLPNVPPPPIDKPIVLFNETISFGIGTSRQAVERALGIAFAYPARGWHTYAVAGPKGERYFVSAFYRNDLLVAVEHYMPMGERSPKLEPRRLGAFRYVPSEVTLGMPSTSIPELFVPAAGGPATIVYDAAFEARFPGGVAFVMMRERIIQRLALYIDEPKTS